MTGSDDRRCAVCGRAIGHREETALCATHLAIRVRELDREVAKYRRRCALLLVGIEALPHSSDCVSRGVPKFPCNCPKSYQLAIDSIRIGETP